ncbi:hypothetical protein EJ05DRAFT_384371 [Pseudovirgaria hyperparasitica]|uniref:Uncharacterized protein n=1 Tax=Pseudovirgaria hyperparasitica TaxID=470096 RepID=A0A6A6VQB8_9PEZI|nr:uncharacterized protein EJ05DRAFT_384371 [Pseudovirgaria hyperparasitica]KAF2752393.1 hypothetical protein EJ05DRAFT_384371 [Pseudovirgaria hyperparasitica]
MKHCAFCGALRDIHSVIDDVSLRLITISTIRNVSIMTTATTDSRRYHHSILSETRVPYKGTFYPRADVARS